MISNNFIPDVVFHIEYKKREQFNPYKPLKPLTGP